MEHPLTITSYLVPDAQFEIDHTIAVPARLIHDEMLARPAQWAFVHPISTALHKLGVDTSGRWSCRYNPRNNHYCFSKIEDMLA